MVVYVVVMHYFKTHFIMQLSCRPRYASRMSICPVRAHNFKTKRRRRIKIGMDVLQGTSKWNANFQMKRSKVKVTGCQKPQKTGVVFTYGEADQAQAD